MATKSGAKAREACAVTIVKYRQLAGLSQVELARRLGVSQPLVSSWECGRVTPSIIDIATLEKTLDTEPGEMLFQIAYPKQFNNPNEETK
jgi:transcriptional regulator with XRE-family HTH domain